MGEGVANARHRSMPEANQTTARRSYSYDSCCFNETWRSPVYRRGLTDHIIFIHIHITSSLVYRRRLSITIIFFFFFQPFIS